ncbi:MAG: glycosyltransferase [Xanthobacteraceae bacterium]|nr:glycosyltransferase [Xanthobacteraceae bacterium]
MSPDQPRLTIVTPSKNGARYLVEAIESVRRQRYPNLEHIVVDACSTDGTLELLARYPDIIVISEPDHGSQDALNKGIARATGDIIGELNVDDLYADGILDAIGKTFAGDESIDVVVGHSLVFEEDISGAKHLLMAHTHARQNGLWLPELTFGIPGICGCFFHRRVFSTVARFRTEYELAADRRLLIALKLAEVKSVRIDQPAILYRHHSGSATINPTKPNLRKLSHEYFRMAAELAQEAANDPTNRRIFLAWHAIEGAKLLLRSLSEWKFDAAAKIVTSLLRQNSWLPVSFVRGLLLREAVRSAIREDERRFGAARHLEDSTPIEHEVAGPPINGTRSYLS